MRDPRVLGPKEVTEPSFPLLRARSTGSRDPSREGPFCGSCNKVVTELAQMTETEARALLHLPPAEGLCVRYFCDEQGQIPHAVSFAAAPYEVFARGRVA
jgi:hypothetical protein